jgi:flagellar biosynthesis protein FlhF
MIIGAGQVASAEAHAPNARLYGITACRSEDLSDAPAVAATPPSGLRRVTTFLREIGVAEATSRMLVEETLARLPLDAISDPERVEAAALDVIGMRFAGPTQAAASGARRRGPRRIALVGPSGAGKTTSVLKLAKRHAARGRGLVIAALHAGQASLSRLYALSSALGATVTIIQRPKEWKSICESMGEGMALLDTGGVSAADAPAIAGVKTFLCEAGIDETNVVIPATLDPDEAHELWSEMGGSPSRRLLVTKIDEAVSLRRVLRLLLDAGSDAAYLGIGADPTADLLDVGPIEARSIAHAAFHGVNGHATREALLQS